MYIKLCFLTEEGDVFIGYCIKKTVWLFCRNHVSVAYRISYAMALVHFEFLRSFFFPNFTFFKKLQKRTYLYI